MELSGRSLCKETDLRAEEILGIVELARRLREEKRSRGEVRRLAGRNLVLIFEKTSTRTRAAFEVAAHDQGASVSFIGPGESQLHAKESVRDTARILGRVYDGIAYRGAAQDTVEQLALHAGIPVWNALTDAWHPTQMLADVLTITDHCAKPLRDVKICYLGDTRNNVARSLLVTCAMLGMDVRLAGPEALWPPRDVVAVAEQLAASSGARVRCTDDVKLAVEGADFLYTDVWVSMGEPVNSWDDRISALLAYQVNAELLATTGNPATKVLHCLPAMHDLETSLGRELHQRYGLSALEITDEVFESPAAVVFDQAENRMHTVKALIVTTLSGDDGR